MGVEADAAGGIDRARREKLAQWPNGSVGECFTAYRDSRVL